MTGNGWIFWPRLQQTLYTKSISKCVRFVFSISLCCCYHLIVRSKMCGPPISHLDDALGSPAARCLTDCCRSSESISRGCCKLARWRGRDPPFVPVTGRRPPLLEREAAAPLGCLIHSCLSGGVPGSQWKDMGGGVNCSLCCLFCLSLHADLRSVDVTFTLFQPAFVQTFASFPEDSLHIYQKHCKSLHSIISRVPLECTKRSSVRRTLEILRNKLNSIRCWRNALAFLHCWRLHSIYTLHTHVFPPAWIHSFTFPPDWRHFYHVSSNTM